MAALAEASSAQIVDPALLPPAELVGQWIFVSDDGKGKGRVVAFTKVSRFNPFMAHSKHTVEFVKGGEQKVLLRRLKGKNFNGGLRFSFCLSPDEESMGIKAWLNRLKSGYGERFIAAFDAVGIESLSDFPGVEGSQTFIQALVDCGAKEVQIKAIVDAMRIVVGKLGPNALGQKGANAVRKLAAAAGDRPDRPPVRRLHSDDRLNTTNSPVDVQVVDFFSPQGQVTGQGHSRPVLDRTSSGKKVSGNRPGLSRQPSQLSGNLIHEFSCPLTLELMVDPVILVEDGNTYERSAVKSALRATPGEFCQNFCNSSTCDRSCIDCADF